MNTEHNALEEAVGHVFHDRTLLDTALIHRSFRYEHEGTCRDNQRLEFLGDAVLGLVAADYLFERLADEQEGTLTRLRSAIINEAALGAVARIIELGRHMRFGHGEAQSGGAERTSNLADGLEALIGAMYLDAGMAPVVAFFKRHFPALLEEVIEGPAAGNPKGALQEFTQKQWQIMPDYRLIAESGPAHDRQFEYEVWLGDQAFGHGIAGSKQQAQTLCALEAIARLVAEKTLDPM